MKRFIFILLIGGIIGSGVVLMSMLSPNTVPVEHKKIEVAATTFPIYDIARTVAGNDAVVHLIVPPGTSPHAFDVSAQTVKNISGSDILFMSGHGVDDWIASLQHALPDVPVVVTDRNISLRTAVSHDEHEEEAHEGEDEREHGPTDPHYWLDPDNAKIMAATIAEELIKIDPAHSEAYTNRKDVFIQELEKQDVVWQAQLASFQQRDILTFHDAFYYFAEHFDLHVVATYEPFVGKEPSPQYLAELHEIVKEHSIRTLFIEPQLSRSGLDAFAADVGATIGVLDEMGGADGKDSYMRLIDANVREVEKALRSQK